MIANALRAESVLFVVILAASCSANIPTTKPTVRPREPREQGSIATPVEPRSPGKTLLASAPRGFSLAGLGRPATADFVPLQGEEGRSLFPDSGPPAVSPQAYMEHELVFIDSEEMLAAHASAWNINLDGGFRNSRRFASYRAVQIAEVYEVDDTTAPRALPPSAVYYPWRVYMGRSYEVLIEGDADDFHAGARAELQLISAGIEGFVKKYNLTLRAVGHGLRPSHGKAIFAKTQEQIEESYTAENEMLVPILVEWREIPGRRGSNREIEWASLRAGCPGQQGCEPCESWVLDYVEWQLPAVDTAGRQWDELSGVPDAVLTLRTKNHEISSPMKETHGFRWKLERPIEVKTGETIHIAAVDVDETEEEFIGSQRFKFDPTYDGQESHVRVSSKDGAAFVLGTCSRPSPSAR